jgi:YrbI family 3-deoxy-D-manno-octulosonate 8-phosphate phosphatase
MAIKMLLLDVDGVLTDGHMYYSPQGEMFKAFNTKDGMAIKHLRSQGIKVGFISAGLSHSKEIVTARAAVFGVDKVYVGTDPKTEIFDAWCEELNIDPIDVAFMGDDVNDLGVIEKAGLTACPANAVPKVKAAVDHVMEANGGDACVREFVDKYISEA